MVASAALPSLERKPGGPDNWVEAVGGLPSYIERIAKHLHYERGMTISHAIASAVNTVKRWARMGKVAKYGDPNNKRVSPVTMAKAQAALAQWEAKKAASHVNLSDETWALIQRLEVIDLVVEMMGAALDLSEEGADAASTRRGTLDSILSSGSLMDTATLAARTSLITDPALQHEVRMRVLNLAGMDYSMLIDLASSPGSTIAPKGGSGGKTRVDKRPSYKKQGKWGHGFKPLDQAARESKAKGSPEAMKRVGRIYGGGGAKGGAGGEASGKPKPKPKTFQTGIHVQAGQGRAGDRSARGRKDDSQQAQISDKGINEKATSVGLLHRAKFADTQDVKRSKAERNKEVSKETRIPKRATQNWDEIPENLKTMRNGKRYVLAVFGGKNTLTEWVGGVHETESTPLNKRKVMRTLSAADAANMTSGQIRAMLKNTKQISPQVRKALNKALQKKIKEQRSRA